MSKLKAYKNRKESLLPVMDVYLNALQEIWVFNVDLKTNTNPDNWIQTKVTCPKCRWTGVERIVGNGHNQHLVEIDKQKMIKESYFCRCPHCHNAWELDATRLFDPKTLALDVNDNLNAGIQEVDNEIKDSKKENK